MVAQFTFQCLFFAALTAGYPGPQGRDITLRILDAKDGTPLKHVGAAIRTLNGGNDNRSLLNAETNSQGIAVFHFTDPVPERIEIIFAPEEFRLCSEVEYLTDRVLEYGVVGTNCCARSAFKYAANPQAAELVIFGKRVTLLDNIRREIP